METNQQVLPEKTLSMMEPPKPLVRLLSASEISLWEAQCGSKANGCDVEIETRTMPTGLPFISRTILTPQEKLNRSAIQIATNTSIPLGQPAMVEAAKLNLSDHGCVEQFANTLKRFVGASTGLKMPVAPHIETLTSIVCALPEILAPASFKDVISATQKQIDHYQTREQGTKYARTMRKYEPRRQDDGEGAVDSWFDRINLGLSPVSEWLAYWSLEKVCELSGLDRTSAELLKGMFYVPSTCVRRDWGRIGALMGLNQRQVAASKKQIERYRGAVSEWLEQETETKNPVCSYDLKSFAEWLRRREAKPREIRAPIPYRALSMAEKWGPCREKVVMQAGEQYADKPQDPYAGGTRVSC